MEPVSLECILGSTDHHTNVVGVVLAWVEVGVVSDKHRHAHLGILGRVECWLFKGVRKTATFTEDLLEGSSELNSVSLASLSEIVEGLLAEVVVFGDGEEGSIEAAFVLEFIQVDNHITDSSATDRLVGLRVDKDAEWDVLEGELSVGIVGDPRL
jgi:hypothetical protein